MIKNRHQRGSLETYLSPALLLSASNASGTLFNCERNFFLYIPEDDDDDVRVL